MTGRLILSRLVRDNVMKEVCAIDGSSILQGIEEMATEITEVDLHLLTPAGSRTYSRWKDKWHTSGVLA